MDFQLKQWREQQQQHESEQEHQQQEQPSAKQPRLVLDFNHPDQHDHDHDHEYEYNHTSSSSSELPLFHVPETTSNKLTNMSPYSPDSSLSATKYPKMGSFFSLVQWQELELQALIFRHMLAGAPIPHELLHLIKKSIITTSPYYHQQFPYYQHSLVQSGYWGKGAMDPEPGRCRRTDGKKWRCSKDVVVGQKYCERHVHRGRNRSRKPVEIPTQTNHTGGNAGGGMLNTNHPLSVQPLTAIRGGGGGGATHFSISEASPSVDLLHLSQRPSKTIIGNEDRLETRKDGPGDGKSSGQILRHFFDDWPRSIQENENGGSN